MMKKLTVLLLFLSMCILTARTAVAYQVISKQSQEYSSETEVSSENSTSTSTSTSTESYQEQKQRGSSNDANKADKRLKVETKTKTKVTTEPEKNRESETTKTAPTAARCQEIKSNLDKHSAAFTTGYQERENKFKRIYQTVTELITRLEDRDVDVTKLQTAANDLQTKRALLLTAADAYITKAEQISELSCETTASERKTRFEELRTARKTYDQALLDVRKVIDTQLKAALQELRSSTQSNQ